jgi:hypothetical protein
MADSKFTQGSSVSVASDATVVGNDVIHTPKVIIEGAVINAGTITLGAVTIKDATTGNEVAVDALGRLSVDGSSVTQPISVLSLPLPTGAATAARQDTSNTTLGNINTGIGLLAKLSDTQPVSIAGTVTVTGGLTDTQLRASPVPVSLTSTTITGNVSITAAALPLPGGAATSANQATEIASLANLDVPLSTRLKPADTLAAVTSITNPVTIVATTLPLPAGAATDASANLLNRDAILGNSVADLLGQILVELRVHTQLLAEGLTLRTDPADLRASITIN